jgi:hypothetical protein
MTIETNERRMSHDPENPQRKPPLRRFRFEADIDLSEGAYRCNCSLCAKARAWFALVPPERFRLIAGADAQSEYQWTPAGRSGSNLHFRFCKTCGVRTAGYGEHGPNGGPFYFIAVAALDDADPDELAASIRYLDGRHDRFDRAPEDVRAM